MKKLLLKKRKKSNEILGEVYLKYPLTEKAKEIYRSCCLLTTLELRMAKNDIENYLIPEYESEVIRIRKMLNNLK